MSVAESCAWESSGEMFPGWEWGRPRGTSNRWLLLGQGISWAAGHAVCRGGGCTPVSWTKLAELILGGGGVFEPGTRVS